MRKAKAIVIFGMVCLLLGCSLSHRDGGKTKREIEEGKNPYVWGEIYKLESTIWPLEKKVESTIVPLEKKVAAMEREMSAMRTEMATLRGLSVQSNFRSAVMQEDIKQLQDDFAEKKTSSKGVSEPAPEIPSAGIIEPAREATSQVLASEPSAAATKASPPARSIMITDIQYQKIDAQDKVLVHLTAIKNPKIQRLVDPPRIVLDFLNTRNAGRESYEIDTNGTFLRKIRIRAYEEPGEKVRLVFDMVPNKRYVIDRKFLPRGNIYAIIIRQSNN